MSARRGAAIASTAAGLAWIAAWVHLLLAHGVTEVNEQKIVLGLTWLDSAKLVGPALLLGAVAIWLVARSSDSAWVRRAAVAAVAGLGVAALGATLGFWTQPFGTYEGASREVGMAAIGAGISVVGSLLMALGLAFFAIVAARERILPVWLALLLVVGASLAVPWLYESIPGVALGIALLALGVRLFSIEQDQPNRVAGTG